MADEAIIGERAVAGREAAREASSVEQEVIALFDHLRDRLLRYLLSRGLAPQDGEEVVQEAFLALYRHLESGKPRNNLRAWIFQVAHNLALKRQELERRDRQKLHGLDLPAVAASNPEHELEWAQRRAQVFGVWNALPDQDRQCLALRAEGLTYREIAKVTGMSLGAVSGSLARSLARFSRANER